MGVIDAVCELAVDIANNDAHGYSQQNRNGNPDYDCSSLICDLWTRCGVDVKAAGASYTGNMVNAFLKCGFHLHPGNIDPVKGDVLLNVKHHTALYIGGGKLVQATIAENGTVHGVPGDQSGTEIGIFPMYSYPWDYILRYDETSPPPLKNDYISYFDSDCIDTKMPQINLYDYGPAVSAMQSALRYHGFYNGNCNGGFDKATETALRKFQTAHKLEVDGICGPITWNELMFWR